MDTAADINTWTHPKTGQVRRYINNWAELAGITVARYGSGNLRQVHIDGEQVSNRKGGATVTGKVWIDADGELHFDHHSDLSLLSIDEKRARIVAALNTSDDGDNTDDVDTVYTFEEAVEALRMDSMSIEDAHLYLEQVIDAGPEIVDQPDNDWVFTSGDLEVIRLQAHYDRNAA